MPTAEKPGQENIGQRLHGMLDRFHDPLFAILDGGHFDDLEDELAEAGIGSRSLFLKGGDESMRRDGPWLVALTDSYSGLRSSATGTEIIAISGPHYLRP